VCLSDPKKQMIQQFQYSWVKIRYLVSFNPKRVPIPLTPCFETLYICDPLGWNHYERLTGQTKIKLQTWYECVSFSLSLPLLPNCYFSAAVVTLARSLSYP
jgi:hypothetical protein